MLRIELSALSAQELRRLLEMARARNQTALAEQLLAELDSRPSRVEDWEPLPMGYGAPLPPPAAETSRPRRNGVMAATAALAAFVSAAVTWGLSVPMAPYAEPAPPAPAEPEPRAAVVLASVAPTVAAPAQTDPPEAAAERAPPPLRLAKVGPARPARDNPCLDLPTAAERLVCGYPSLAAQDRQLRTAYERAVAAGADRRELDRAQAAWRGESERVSDRKQLADRYARRIRELESAAVRPPPPPAPPREEPVF